MTGLRGYMRGSTPEDEMRAIRESVTRAVAVIRAYPDIAQAFRYATALGELGAQIRSDVADFRAWLVKDLIDKGDLSLAQAGVVLGLDKSSVNQMVRRARRRGNPIVEMDPGTQPELLPVAAAIVVSGEGVLVEHRIDQIPPWTFPATEIRPGESPAAALERRVPEETGIQVAVQYVLGRRLHPRTGHLMVYLAARPVGGDLGLGTPEDLDVVKWAAVAETREMMPDMFEAARAYLDGLEA